MEFPETLSSNYETTNLVGNTNPITWILYELKQIMTNLLPDKFMLEGTCSHAP